MIKFAISVYILVLSCGAVSALFAFIFDVIKWHNMERKENIISSADQIYSKGGALNGRAGSIGTGTGRDTGDGDNDNDTERTKPNFCLHDTNSCINNRFNTVHIIPPYTGSSQRPIRSITLPRTNLKRKKPKIKPTQVIIKLSLKSK